MQLPQYKPKNKNVRRSIEATAHQYKLKLRCQNCKMQPPEAGINCSELDTTPHPNNIKSCIR